jgi:hypothetical protein
MESNLESFLEKIRKEHLKREGKLCIFKNKPVTTKTYLPN